MSKYRAQPVTVDGIRFASKKEAKRYGELKLLERSGDIRNLMTQTAFKCVVNGNLVCSYKADFTYFRYGKSIVEDVKGYRTPIYKLKKKLVEACFPGVEIVEI